MYFLVKLSGSKSRFYFVRQQKQLGTLNGYIQEIISGLKDMINQNAPSEEEIESARSRILELAEKYNIQLSDRQIEQLEELGESLENIDIESLQEHVDQAKETIQHVSEAKDKAVSFFEKFSGAVSAVSDFFGKIKELIGK